MHVNPLRTWSRLSPSYTTDADAGRTSGQAPSPLSLSGTKSQVELSSWVPISHGQWESLIGRVTWDSDCWLVATLMCPALPVCLYRTHTNPFLLLVSCPTVLTLNLHLPSRVNHEHLMLKLLRIKASYPDTSASIFRYFRHSISTPGMSFILSIHCAFMWRTQLKNLYFVLAQCGASKKYCNVAIRDIMGWPRGDFLQHPAPISLMDGEAERWPSKNSRSITPSNYNLIIINCY